MPSFNNYTFTDIQYTIPEGSNVSILYPTAQITIVPNEGYTAVAADFSLDSSFSDNAVQSVVFTQDGSNVLCTVTFDTGFVMPSGNYTIPLCVVGEGKVGEITIGGTISADVGANITGDVSESNTPYANSGLVGETELLLTRSYTAASGYYLTSTGLQVVEGNASNYNIIQGPTYDVDGNLTGISYAVRYTYPNQSIAGDRLSISEVAAEQIFVAPQYVTSYSSLPSTVSGFGGQFTNWQIFGGEGASVTAIMTDTSGGSWALINNQTIGSTGILTVPVVEFPDIVGMANEEIYTITLSGDLDPNFAQSNPIMIYQSTVSPRIEFTATTSGNITGFTPVVKTSSAFSDFQTSPQIVKIEWNLTSSSLLVPYQEEGANVLTNTSFNTFEVTAAATNSPTLTINDTSNLVVGSEFSFNGTDRGVYEYKITAINSPTEIAVSPNITATSGLKAAAYTNNGNNVEINSISLSSKGDGSIDFVANVAINYFGAADTTFTFLLDDLIKEIPLINCGATATSGSEGVTDHVITLDPAGGLIAFLVRPESVRDKFEIIHGSPASNFLVKKATSSMTAANNSGPFDNVFGTEANNQIPTVDQANNTDQFIGTALFATVPDKTTEFLDDTGFTIPTMTVGGIAYQQVVWWEYTAADYDNNSSAFFRITGPSGTAWGILRLCCPDANCT